MIFLIISLDILTDYWIAFRKSLDFALLLKKQLLETDETLSIKISDFSVLEDPQVPARPSSKVDGFVSRKQHVNLKIVGQAE